MHPPVQSLQHFYATPLGRWVGHVLRAELAVLPPLPTTARTLIIGYAPILFAQAPATFTVWGMPAKLGGYTWPDSAHPQCIQLLERSLPFADLTFDRIILLHELEYAEGVQAVLTECYRTLRPKGELLVFTPNRRGAWARREISPFARGNPYSLNQVQRLLVTHQFTPMHSYTTLFTPPTNRWWVLHRAHLWEALGHRLGSQMGGIVVCLARKDVFTGTLLPTTTRAKIRPLLQPVTH